MVNGLVVLATMFVDGLLYKSEQPIELSVVTKSLEKKDVSFLVHLITLDYIRIFRILVLFT